tara:strand:+ start:5690 stop:5851 length:162 start_codon:yes stop_codon:yes gene_type:complete
MKVGDLVVDADGNLGIIIGEEEPSYGMFRVWWHYSNTSTWFHNGRMEVVNESR